MSGRPLLAWLAAGVVAVGAAGCAGGGTSGAVPSLAPVTAHPSVTAQASQRTTSAQPDPSATATPSKTAKTTKPRTTSPRPRGSVTYVATEPLPRGCWPVSPAITGIKVYLVQRALHLVGHKERYDSATAAAVRTFQSARHLPVTGVVDLTTWNALATGYDFCVDRYTAQPTVGVTASASARISAEIGYASARLGLPYVWGGAGPMGFDCSGLVLQALYAAGVRVPGINTDLHVQADFRTTQALYASKLPHVPFSQRRRGDLIFYGSPISHMAIYLGGGRILEAVRPVLRTASTMADGLPAQPYVVRPFPS